MDGMIMKEIGEDHFMRPLTDRQVEKVSQRLDKLVGSCATCMPYDSGDPVWLGSHWQFTESVQEALDKERISRNPAGINAIADQLEFHCPGCGAVLESGSEVGEAIVPEELGFISDARRFDTALVPALIMFGDVSGFSTWAKRIRSPVRVGDFLKHFYALVMEEFGYSSPAFVKMLGDGVMFVWELRDTNMADRVSHIVACACKFPYGHLTAHFRGSIPPGMRFGFSTGEIVRLVKRDSNDTEHFKDYVGYPVNLAYRIQSHAESRKVHIHGDVKKLLDKNFVCKPVKPKPLSGIRNKDLTDIWETFCHMSPEREDINIKY